MGRPSLLSSHHHNRLGQAPLGWRSTEVGRTRLARLLRCYYQLRITHEDVVVQTEVPWPEVKVILLESVLLHRVRNNGLSPRLRSAEWWGRYTFAGSAIESRIRYARLDITPISRRSAEGAGGATPCVIGRQRSRRCIGRIHRSLRAHDERWKPRSCHGEETSDGR